MFPPRLDRSQSSNPIQSIQSSKKTIQRAARSKNKDWRSKNKDLLPSLGLATSKSAAVLKRHSPNKATATQEDDLLFQQLQRSIDHHRQRAHRKRLKRQRRRHQKQQKHHPSSMSAAAAAAVEDATDSSDATHSMGKTLRRATRRCSTIGSDRKHLLSLISTCLSHVSNNLTPGPIVGLVGSIGSAVLALTEMENVQSQHAKTAVAAQMEQQSNPNGSHTNSNKNNQVQSHALPEIVYTDLDNTDSLYDAYKTRWKKSDDKRSMREKEPDAILKKVHSNLKDAVRAPLAINDWAEELITEEMLKDGSSNANEMKMEPSVSTAEFDLQHSQLQPPPRESMWSFCIHQKRPT